jgi:erythromycin esterase
MTSDARPVAGSIVILSDPSTVDEVAMTHTDSAGRFLVNSPIRSVALTATTAEEWFYVPKIDIADSQITIQLKRGCTQLTGRIILDDPQPWPRIEMLRIGGFDKSVQGIFGMHVNDEYQFSACLPNSEYYISFPTGFVEQTILTMIPPPRPLTVHSASQHAATTIPTVSPRVRGRDRSAFVDDVPATVRLLGLGEANHGSHEFTLERGQLATTLARQHQFALILLEAGYGEVLALDDYIKGQSISIIEAIDKLDYWMWYTKGFRKLLDELREYNRQASPEKRVSLRGIDIRTTAGAIDDLKAADVGLSAPELELLERLRDRNSVRWKESSADERIALRRMLERVASGRDSSGLDSTRNRHALSARSLLLTLDLPEQEDFWNRSRVRDKAMATLTLELLDSAPHVRATLWAHLIHIAREFVVGAPTLGGHLAVALGQRYRAYALLAYSGTARARDAGNKRGVVPHSLPRAPPYSLESVLRTFEPAATSDISYWTFQDASGAGADWFQKLHYVGLFGAYYPATGFPFQVLDLTAFDGAVLFPRVAPIEPLTPKKFINASD